MNSLLHWLTSPEWTHVVGALLHSLWQGAIIALAFAVLMRRLTNPVTRYRCALVTLSLVIISGLVTWAVLTAPKPAVRVATPIPGIESTVAPLGTAALNPDSADKIVALGRMSPPPTPKYWIACLAVLWMLGAVVMLLRAGIKVAGAEKLRRSCQPLHDERMVALVAEARRAVGLARQIRVAVTDKLTSPAVVGVIVPTLILPLSLFTALTPEQIRFILLHELAHIRRGDYFANLFQLLAEALLFFNPAVWWISHQIPREREASCDALAIELSGAPADYARTLVRVAENILQPATNAALAFGDGQREPSSLADRVQRLLVPGYRPALRLTWRAMLASLIVGGTLLVLSAVGTRSTVGAILSPREKAASEPLISAPITNFGSNSTTTPVPATLTGIMTDPQFREVVKAINQRSGVNSPNKDQVTQLNDRRAQVLISAVNNNNLATGIENLPARRGAGETTTDDIANQANPTLVQPTASPNSSDPAHNQGAPFVTQSNANSDTTFPNVRGSSGAVDLSTRTFIVGPVELAHALGRGGPVQVTNAAAMVQELMVKAGVDLKPPKTVIFKDTLGLLMVRATKAELDTIEICLVQTNQSPASGKLSPGNTGEAKAMIPVPKANLTGSVEESSTNLILRVYKVDAKAMVKALDAALGNNVGSGTKSTNDSRTLLPDIQKFFAILGVELQPPKTVFFNETKGQLLVRATLADLNTIEQVLQVLNNQTPQVNIRTMFVEVPGDGSGDTFLGNLISPPPQSKRNASRKKGAISANAFTGSNVFTGILTEPQFKAVLAALEERGDVKFLSRQDVTTLSGRQAQMQTVEIRTIVTGLSTNLPLGEANGQVKTEQLPFGPVLDVIPFVSSDGHTIAMTVIPTVTEFLGYDEPEKNITNYAKSKNMPTALPLPRFRSRQVTTSANVWDGQTLVLGGFVAQEVIRKPDGSEVRQRSDKAEKRSLLVFITATIIDPAGNRVNPVEEPLPSSPPTSK